MEREARRAHRARPTVEGLEDRVVLNAAHPTAIAAREQRLLSLRAERAAEIALLAGRHAATRVSATRLRAAESVRNGPRLAATGGIGIQAVAASDPPAAATAPAGTSTGVGAVVAPVGGTAPAAVGTSGTVGSSSVGFSPAGLTANFAGIPGFGGGTNTVGGLANAGGLPGSGGANVVGGVAAGLGGVAGVLRGVAALSGGTSPVSGVSVSLPTPLPAATLDVGTTPPNGTSTGVSGIPAAFTGGGGAGGGIGGAGGGGGGIGLSPLSGTSVNTPAPVIPITDIGVPA